MYNDALMYDSKYSAIKTKDGQRNTKVCINYHKLNTSENFLIYKISGFIVQYTSHTRIQVII